MSRWIVADDFDTGITYTGDWLGVKGLFNSTKADVSVQNAIAKSGHKLTSNGTLSFSFTGTDVAVFGVSSALSNTTAGGKATIECFVDGKSIGGSNTFGVFPWTSYCSTTGLADSQHLLTATMTADEENPFWLDFIRYAPASDLMAAGKLLMIDSTDPAVEYTASAAWSAQGDANVTTISANPALTLNFTGTSLTWFSLSSDALSRITANSTVTKDQYASDLTASLDGQKIVIGLPLLQGPDFSYNKILFEPNNPFTPGEHTFALDFSPTPQSQEFLALDFFLIQVGAVSGPSSISINSAFISPPPAQTHAPQTTSATGFIPPSPAQTQVPQTTSATKMPNQGFSNYDSAGFVSLAMLVTTLIRIVGW